MEDHDQDFLVPPPSSLDLNQTEHLWDHLHWYVVCMDPPTHTFQQLWDALQSAWLQIPVTTYQDLTESLPARLAAVRAAHGS